jgi:hypothetical protein
MPFIVFQSALSNLEEMKAGRSDSPMVYRERVVHSVGVGPMRSRPNEKRIDTSPYSSGAYLSPPPDTSWRRANSDSALHQSAMNMGSDTSLHNSGSQRRGEILYIPEDGIHHSPHCENFKSYIALTGWTL